MSAAIPTQEIVDLYHQGKFLTAYHRCEAAGGLDALEGPAGRQLAGRLATRLGAPRLGQAIHWRAWRQFPNTNALVFYVSACIRDRQGPWEAIQFLRRQLPRVTSEEDRKTHRDCLAGLTSLYSSLRDFESARQHLQRAQKLDDRDPWLCIAAGGLLDAEDRREEALEAYRQALALQAYYEPGVRAVAESLVQLDRADEAMQLLREASTQLESGNVLVHLATIQTELEAHRDASDSFEQAMQFFPLLGHGRGLKKWLCVHRSYTAYHCGEIERAAELAEETGYEPLEALAARLRKNRETGKRVLLDVGFIRQAHVTCVPATLANLSRFWSRDHEHMDVAEEICYDGTPSHDDRDWAVRHGFHAKEFKVTWEASTALIDAGIPFALLTVGMDMGHMQAVIGYDSFREVLLIRDPGERRVTEISIHELVEHLQCTGPRGLAFVPPEQAAILDQMQLPESELYDHNFELHLALKNHDRDAAYAAYERMQAVAPDHRLSLYGRARIAHYDTDRVALAQCTNRLLEQFPDDPNQLSVKLGLLQESGTRDQRLEILKQINEHAALRRSFEPRLVTELLDDAREHEAALRLLRRCIRRRPHDGHLYSLQSQILWERGRRGEAWELLRVAACLEDRNEHRAASYFRAARMLNRQDAALQFLQQRAARLGTAASGAARTLADAYEHLNREQEAMQVLKQSMGAHPEDGGLRLYVAEFLARFGKHDQAMELWKGAEGKCPPQAWHQTAAHLANHRFDLTAALESAQRVLDITPLDGDANALVAKLLTDLHGPDAAIRHLRSQLERFPHHAQFRSHLIELLDRDDLSRLASEVNEFLRLHPKNPWALRELALVHLRQNQLPAALQHANEANALEPTAPASQYVLGLVSEAAGQRETSKKCFRNAIRLSVDYQPAIHKLIRACKTKQERQEALGFVYEQLTTQSLAGDGLISFRDLAATTYSPEKLLSILHQAMKDRPDLWHAWSALITQLVSMNRSKDAVRIAEGAVERFPMLPRIHVDAAAAYRAAGDQQARIRALNRALVINGGYGEALRSLADAQLDAKNPQGALVALKRAIAREPQEITHRGELANLYWKTGNREAAIQHIQHAIRREPGYEWGWRQLQQWAEVTKQPEAVLNLASLITKDRSQSAEAWKLRADILSEFPDRFEKALQSVKKALELNPRHIGAHDLHAQLWAQRGVFDKAIAACQPPDFAKDRPLALIAREAELEARRGQLGQAIEKMKLVVQQDPDHAFAWSCLANWYRTEHRVADYVTAAGHLTRVSPEVGLSWGYLGHAKMLANARQEAKQCFARAMELDPTDSFTAQTLQDMQIEDGEFDNAWRTLQRAAPHLTDEQRLTQEIRILVLAKKMAQAHKRFRELCRAKLEDVAALITAMDELLPVGGASEIKSDLADAIQDAQASPYVAAAWVELMAREVRLATIEQLAKEGACSKEKWTELTCHYLTILTEAHATERLNQFVERFRPIIRASHVAWSAVGNALKDMDQCEEAIEWMSDWQSRPGVNGRLLFPLMLAAVMSEDDELAVAVARFVLAQPDDFARNEYWLWVAALALEGGDLQRATTSLSHVDRMGLIEYYRVLYQLVSLTLRIMELPAARQDWKQSFGRFMGICESIPASLQGDSLLQRLQVSFGGAIARHFGKSPRAATKHLRATPSKR